MLARTAGRRSAPAPFPKPAGSSGPRSTITWRAAGARSPAARRSRLLAEQRGARLGASDPALTEAQIVAWADAHRRRTGEWPAASAGPIVDAPGETWGGLSRALAHGRRGLPGGSSLAKLLAQHRGVRNPQDLPPLIEDQLLAWADAHHARTGEWPTPASGPIDETDGETWMAVEKALRTGGRGLAGGSSLYQLLVRQLPIENPRRRPTLTVERVLAWATAHRQRTGQWPTAESGPIGDAPGETWREVDACLTHGDRGLPRGAPLARFLAENRLAHDQRPHLTVAEILAWADAFRARHGRWPQAESGMVEERLSETWLAVDSALRQGDRGMAGGSSLALLLTEQRPGAPAPVTAVSLNGASLIRKTGQPDLEIEQILAWADAHHDRTGQWPVQLSGRVAEAPHEKWANLDGALRFGRRGLPRGSSLARLLTEHRGARNPQALPPFSEPQIVAWADAHHARIGEWPSAASGPIAEAPGETWKRVADALLKGQRGLPGGASLSALLAEHRGVRNSHAVPPIAAAQILAWADAHRRAPAAGRRSTPARSRRRRARTGMRSSRRSAWAAAACRAAPRWPACFIEERRAVPNPAARPPLTFPLILSWADDYHERTGEWPDRHSGPIPAAPGDTWAGVDSALQQGVRGLPGGLSLPRLLAEHRRVRFNAKAPDLTEAQILAWPTRSTRAPGDGRPRTPDRSPRPRASRGMPCRRRSCTATGVCRAAHAGPPAGRAARRAEPGSPRSEGDGPPSPRRGTGSRLGGRPSRAARPLARRRLRADRSRTGRDLGRRGVCPANRQPGLPGGSSLARLLVDRRGHRNHLALPPLTLDQVLAWADTHHGRTGSWPSRKSGGVAGTDGETWSAIDDCLMSGKRGLPGG